MSRERVPRGYIHGAFSGLATCIALQPLDLIRTRLQETPSTVRKPKIMPIVRSIYRQEGITGLWRGTAPSLWRMAPGAAIFFGSINQLKYLLVVGYNRKLITNPLLIDQANRRLSMLGGILVGAGARSIAAFIMMPMTVVKTRFESLAYRKQYETTSGALSAIWSAEGVRGLWRGWGSTIMRDAPYSGLAFAILERLKPVLGNDLKGVASSSFLAGASATFLTTPFDAARTRVQLKPSSYPSMLTAFSKIGREEGAAGFYRGAMPRMVRKTLSSAISWAIFEHLMSRSSSK